MAEDMVKKVGPLDEKSMASWTKELCVGLQALTYEHILRGFSSQAASFVTPPLLRSRFNSRILQHSKLLPWRVYQPKYGV
jgi:hypothetical protein